MQEIPVEEKLRQFVKDYCDGRCSLGLLMLLARHPNARFSRLAIVHGLDARRADIEKALQYLIDRRLVVAWTAESGLPLYSLTEDEPPRGLALDLVALGWRQCQRVLEQALAPGCSALAK